MQFQIGVSVVRGFACASTGSFFALVKDSENCNFGLVQIAARCLLTATGLEYASPFQYVAIKIQDKAQVLHAMQHRLPGDSALLEKALLTTMAQEPHIIHVHECWHDATHLYTVMEFGEMDLMDTIASAPDAALPEDEARDFFRQFLLGLRSLHRLGYCCRDLSSENAVVVGGDRVLKLIDFGACLRVPVGADGKPALFPAGTPFGKASYMAPEYYAGLAYDGFKADIWSAGTILFTMVEGDIMYETPTGDDPSFCGGNIRDKLDQIDVRRGMEGREPLSEAVRATLCALLVLDVEQRLSTVDAVLDLPWLHEVDGAGGAGAAAAGAPVAVPPVAVPPVAAPPGAFSAPPSADVPPPGPAPALSLPPAARPGQAPDCGLDADGDILDMG